MKRLKEGIDRSTRAGKKKKTTKGLSLIVEFSIENIQVTKRRDVSQKDQAAIVSSCGVLWRFNNLLTFFLCLNSAPILKHQSANARKTIL